MAVPTGMGELRNGLVVRSADVVVACGSSAGTLSEVALAVRTRRPVVAIGGWRIERIAGWDEDAFSRADDPEHALLAVWPLLERRGGRSV